MGWPGVGQGTVYEKDLKLLWELKKFVQVLEQELGWSHWQAWRRDWWPGENTALIKSVARTGVHISTANLCIRFIQERTHYSVSLSPSWVSIVPFLTLIHCGLFRTSVIFFYLLCLFLQDLRVIFKANSGFRGQTSLLEWTAGDRRTSNEKNA